MAKLTVIHGAQMGQEFDVRSSESSLGRSPECDVILDSAAVSRNHAIVVRDGDQYFVRDNGSRNGTFVNGERIVAQRALQTGDVLTICDIQLLFKGVPELAATKIAESPPSTLSGSLLGQREEEDEGRSTIMAMIDVSGGGSVNWHFSARPEVQLQAMVEIMSSLANSLSIKEILPRLLDSLFKIFLQADRGFVIMRQRADGPLIPVAVKARRGNEDQGMRFSRTIVERAMVEKQAILSADAATDERFNMSQSISDIQIRSLICAPLVNADGIPLGVLQIDTSDQRSRFTDQDLQVLAGVASQAAIAMDNARMHEEAIEQLALQRDLEVAHEMQRALLPAHAPTIEGYHFFQYYQSAHQVGGDYYDYILLPDDRFAAVVGDVAGKGVSAAILMAKLSSDVRYWLAREPDPAKAMGKINATFCRHGWDDRFVTMVAAVVDPNKGELTLVNAGHMPPLLRSSSGVVEEIGGKEAGLPLGVVDDYEFEAHRRGFAPGECLTIFTDGFSEAMNSKRELFGLERVAELAGNKAIESVALGPYILDQVKKFAGDFPQSDDMCLVCFGRH